MVNSEPPLGIVEGRFLEWRWDVPDRITELSDAQRASFDSYVQDWIARSHETGAMLHADREAVVAGIRECYAAAGLPWHDNIFWAGSPARAAGAANVAAVKCHAIRHPPGPLPPPPWRAWYKVLGIALGGALGGAVIGLVLGAAVGGMVGGVSAYVHVGGVLAVIGAIIGGLFGLGIFADNPNFLGAILIPLSGAYLSIVGASIGAALMGEKIPWPGTAIVDTGRAWALVGAPLGAVALAVISGISSVREPAPKEVSPPSLPRPPADTTADRIERAILNEVSAAVVRSVSQSVLVELQQQIDGPITTAAVHLHATTETFAHRNRFHYLSGRLPDNETAEVVYRIVDAVQPAPLTSPPGTPAGPDEEIVGCVAGRYAATKLAAAVWLRSHAGLELPDELWAHVQAYQAANRAGWWWPYADFVVICEPPLSQPVDSLGLVDGYVLWPDGSSGWFDHGQERPIEDDEDDEDLNASVGF